MLQVEGKSPANRQLSASSYSQQQRAEEPRQTQSVLRLLEDEDWPDAEGAAPRPLAADLTEWRLAQGIPDDSGLVFPGRDGEVWSDDAWRYGDTCLRARRAATRHQGPIRPYDPRHSFVALLLAEGATVVELARQAGHLPTMTLSTYGHLFEELEGAEPSFG
jgi:integrase